MKRSIYPKSAFANYLQERARAAVFVHEPQVGWWVHVGVGACLILALISLYQLDIPRYRDVRLPGSWSGSEPVPILLDADISLKGNEKVVIRCHDGSIKTSFVVAVPGRDLIQAEAQRRFSGLDAKNIPVRIAYAAMSAVPPCLQSTSSASVQVGVERALAIVGQRLISYMVAKK